MRLRALLYLPLLVVACSNQAARPGVSAGPAPWPAPSDARARILAANLPALPSERFEYHVHAHLDVFVDGDSQPVPARIGIDSRRRVISPLHTHEGNGIIHIESGTETVFTLGQFFVQWGVRLDRNCVGSYCIPATPFRLYVNGAERPGDLRSAQLGSHDELALVIGAPPAQVPAAFSFPPPL